MDAAVLDKTERKGGEIGHQFGDDLTKKREGKEKNRGKRKKQKSCPSFRHLQLLLITLLYEDE